MNSSMLRKWVVAGMVAFGAAGFTAYQDNPSQSGARGTSASGTGGSDKSTMGSTNSSSSTDKSTSDRSGTGSTTGTGGSGSSDKKKDAGAETR
jgi:hypothetical protein